MARKVYLYRSIAHLRAHPLYEAWKGLPQITVSNDLFRAMKKRYPEIENLVDIHKVQKGITGDWDSETTAFQQFLRLGGVLRRISVPEEQRARRRSFEKNKRDILNGIRLLVEADIKPEQLDPVNGEERLYRAVWERLEKEDASFGQFRSLFARLQANAETRAAVLEDLIPGFASEQIVIHGFYIITPIQERIFELLEACGKQLIFLCCVDSRFPAVHQIWYETLSPKFGFPPVDEWAEDDWEGGRNVPFGAVFEGGDGGSMGHVRIKSYASEVEFVSDVNRLTAEGFQIFSTDVKAGEALLREFFPERFSRRHLLAYPAGQYIYQLHTMWNAQHERLELTMDGIQICFASGLVIAEGKNAREYTEDLEKLRVYVSDCRTVEEWEARLTLLQKTGVRASAPFEEHLPGVPAQHRSQHRTMANPLLNFSCFSLEPERLKELLALIRHLLETAKELFSGKKEVNIDRHFQRLRKMLEAGCGEESLLKEERAILDELSARLRLSKRLNIRTCLPGELSEALLLMIGGGILDEDSCRIQTAYPETFLLPMYQMDSFPLTGSGKAHLCFADEARLPGRKRRLVWPLSDDLLDRLEVPASSPAARYLAQMRHIIDSAPQINRYFFFSLLRNRKVELSYIREQDGKEAGPSPYLQMLNQVFQIPIEAYGTGSDAAEKQLPAPYAEPLRVSLSGDLSREAELDLMLCPWRYVYGYLLNERPSYQGEFHYSFAIARLIGVLKHRMGPQQGVEEQVFQLFPYLRSVERQQIRDYVTTKYEDQWDSLDGVSYPRERLAVHHLRREMTERAEAALEDQYEKGLEYASGLNPPDNGEVCKYCSFSDNCPHRIGNGERGGQRHD